MKKKNVMGRGKRTLLLFAKRVLTAAAIGSVIAIISNSFITVEGTNGKSRYFISPFAQKEMFEDWRLLMISCVRMPRILPECPSSKASWKRTASMMERNRSISPHM